MKKLLLSLLFLWQFNCELKAQSSVYKPFPTDSTVWYSEYQSAIAYYYNYYQMLGDTILSNVPYKKLYHCQIGSFNPLTQQQHIVKYGFFGGIRQDTTLRKVYYKYFGANEVILYDYNVSMGDTVPQFFWTGNQYTGLTTVVSGFDSALVDGKFHKSIKLIDINSPTTVVGDLVEGIGNLAGLFLYKRNPTPGNSDLRCVSVQNKSIYSFGSGYTCPLTVGFFENIKEVEFSIHPNPIKEKTQLSILGINASHFEITNLIGQIILNAEIIDDKTEIDLSEHNNGVYFIRVYDKSGNFSAKKIIKQ